MSEANVRVYEDTRKLAEAAASKFVELAQRSIEERGRFAVALAGGSTPRVAYELLAERYREDLDWSRVHVFFGDERNVPPDDEDSNFRMARKALLDHVFAGGVYRMPGEQKPEEAADLYEGALEEFFGAEGPPVFDLVLLGIGEDGHTASLFPHTPALDERERWAAANPVEKLGTTRITLTLPVLNAARAVLFLAAGEGKAEALREVLDGDADPHEYPAKLVRPEGEINWMLDPAAAGQLS